MFVQHAQNVAELVKYDTTFHVGHDIRQPAKPTQVHRWLLELDLLRSSAYMGPRTILLIEANPND